MLANSEEYNLSFCSLVSCSIKHIYDGHFSAQAKTHNMLCLTQGFHSTMDKWSCIMAPHYCRNCTSRNCIPWSLILKTPILIVLGREIHNERKALILKVNSHDFRYLSVCCVRSAERLAEAYLIPNFPSYTATVTSCPRTKPPICRRDELPIYLSIYLFSQLLIDFFQLIWISQI